MARPRLRDRLHSAWNRLPLRRQLVLSLWLCTIPISAAGSALVMRQAYEHAKQETRHAMVHNLATMAQVMRDWLGDNQAWLRQLAEGPSVRNLDPTTSQDLLNRARASFPSVELSVYRRDGSLVASNAAARPGTDRANTQRRLGSGWFQSALRGQNGLELWERNSNGMQCLIQARPIRRAGQTIGVLQACIPPEHAGAKSGISALLDAEDLDGDPISWLDLDQGIRKGWGILMVSDRGQLMLLHKKGAAVTGAGRLSDPGRIRSSGWAGLVQAVQAMALRPAQPVQSAFDGYFIAASPLAPGFRLATVVDKDTSLKQVREVAYGMVATNLVALLISSLAIASISKPLLKPIDQAGEALRRISDGDFDVTLTGSPNNDIGRLFSDITTSARKLKTFVAEATRHAVNTAQISEAKRLQAGFLIEKLPETDTLEIAALCQPAYDIGADWYDAIALGDARVVVVADVCDKGIPSALYMSVFRSLLRLSLVKEWDNSHSCASSIATAVSTVNRYMAETHGDTGMFATAFVGVYEPQLQTLSYVLAGHESPRLLRAGPLPPCSLELSGPALGLFPQAQFQLHSCPLQPGDLLLAFSDGLPDGRNAAGEAFGQARLDQLLRSLDPARLTARELLARVLSAVQEHCQDSEPFDDLTLLALKHRTAP